MSNLLKRKKKKNSAFNCYVPTNPTDLSFMNDDVCMAQRLNQYKWFMVINLKSQKLNHFF